MRYPPKIQRKVLRRTLGLPEYLDADFQTTFLKVDIPLGYEGTQGVLTADVVVRPRPNKPHKSSAHRIFVVCPHCRKEIPAGRWHQHLPVHLRDNL
jgi:hypothetical protein